MSKLTTALAVVGAVYFAIASHGASSRADQAERERDCYETIFLALERGAAEQQREYEFVVDNGFKNNPNYRGIERDYSFHAKQLPECFRTGGVG